MRVLYLIDTLQPGGSEKSLLDILSQRTNIQAVVCSIYQGNQLRASFEAKGIAVESFSIPAKYAFRKAIARMKALLKRESFDLIHATLARANFIGRYAAHQTNLPIISSLVNESYSGERLKLMSAVRKRKLQFVQQIDRWTAPWVTHFVANSETVKKAYCRDLSIPDEKITVIYRGRATEPFDAVSEQELDQLRGSLGLKPGDKIILNVARLVQQKAHTDLLQAFSIVRNHCNDARLVIAGDGPLSSQLKARIAEMQLQNEVLLTGYRSDVPELLKLADVFVFPSLYEGHPGSLIEAMMGGCPIVASDIPVHRETLTQGETGWMVPLRSPQMLAEKILEVFENPDRSKLLGSNAAKEARERFDIRKTASSHEQLYKMILQETNSAAAQSQLI